MNKIQKLKLERQLIKVKKETEKLTKMEGFEEIDIQKSDIVRRFGDKLREYYH